MKPENKRLLFFIAVSLLPILMAMILVLIAFLYFAGEIENAALPQVISP